MIALAGAVAMNGSSDKSTSSTTSTATSRAADQTTSTAPEAEVGACLNPQDEFPAGCELTASLSSSIVKDLASQVFQRYAFTFDPDDTRAIQTCDFADPAVRGTRFTCTFSLPDGRTATATATITDDLFYEVVDVTVS
jgi:hypothetical protein